MTNRSYFSIVLIAITVLLTALAILVVFTTPALIGIGNAGDDQNNFAGKIRNDRSGLPPKGNQHEIRSCN